MLRVTTLGSGSKGNSLIVEIGSARIAVDAGYGIRTLARRLKVAGIAPQSVHLCAITHEHLDHIQSAIRVRDKWQWTIASTAPTLAAIGATASDPRTKALGYGDTVTVGDVRVTLLEISHDAAAPSAVLIEDTKSGARVGIAHDLGVVPEALAEAFARLDVLVLESNHDTGMLRSGPYPPVVQDRIASVRGHLSNDQAAAFARRVVHPGLKALVLAHLSEQNNTPKIARTHMARALAGTRFRGTLIPAAQNSVCAVGDKQDHQLRLF